MKKSELKQIIRECIKEIGRHDTRSFKSLQYDYDNMTPEDGPECPDECPWCSGEVDIAPGAGTWWECQEDNCGWTSKSD